MQCYYVIDWMILKSRMHYEFSLCKYMTSKLKLYIFFVMTCICICEIHSLNAIDFALLILTLFMIFAHTLKNNLT
jgi:hypothetical protein